VTLESQGKSGVTPNFPGRLDVIAQLPLTVDLPGDFDFQGIALGEVQGRYRARPL
jgi:hypothetical protein